MALRMTFLAAAALVLAACFSRAGGCEGDGCFLPHSLIGCAPPPPPGTRAAEPGDAAAFRAALSPLLAALPSSAAATGFASLRSAGADRAHALGLCFGEPGRCLACLAAATAAVAEGCGNDTRRAGAWSEGCVLAYAAGEDAASVGDAFQFPAGGYTRDQVLADLARALAEAKGKSLWSKALSVLFYALAAVGAITIVLFLCALIAIFMFAEVLVRNSAAGHTAAGQGQAGEGVTACVVATSGQSLLWSVAAQIRLY